MDLTVKKFWFEQCFKTESSEQNLVHMRYVVLDTNHPFLKHKLTFLAYIFGILTNTDSVCPRFKPWY